MLRSPERPIPPLREFPHAHPVRVPADPRLAPPRLRPVRRRRRRAGDRRARAVPREHGHHVRAVPRLQPLRQRRLARRPPRFRPPTPAGAASRSWPSATRRSCSGSSSAPRRRQDAAPGSDTERLGTAWCACMDSATADALGATPIAPLLAAIDALTGAPGARRAGGRAARRRRPGAVLLPVAAGPEAQRAGDRLRRPGRPRAARPRLLPARRTRPRSRPGARYVAHVARTFELLGDGRGAARGRRPGASSRSRPRWPTPR